MDSIQQLRRLSSSHVDSNTDVTQFKELLQGILDEKGVDVNHVDLNGLGWTPLHWTTCAGKLDLVKILVEEFGAKTSVKTVDGETPMDLGRSQQHVVEYFATVDSESKG